MNGIQISIAFSCMFVSIHSKQGIVEYAVNSNVYSSCDVSNVTMTCPDIPGTVPSFIRQVIVRDHPGTLKNAFLGQGWANVDVLYIAGNTDKIENGHLKGLDSVRKLTLSFPHFVEISSKAFVDIPAIQALCLLEMGYLHMDTLVASLTQLGVLRNLTELYFNPGVRINPPRVHFSNSVTLAFLDKPLFKFNFSQTIFQSDVQAAVKLALKVDVMNDSGSYLMFTDSRFTGESALSLLRSNEDTPLLQVLDISGITVPFRLLSQPVDILKFARLKDVLCKVQHIYADNVFRKDNVISTSYNATDTKTFLKTLYFRRNNVRKINCTYTFNEDNTIELVDISENKIEYVSSRIIPTAIHLKTINLSYNRLFCMQWSPEFLYLFVSYKNLSALYLNSNNLSYIPWNMFVNNVNLEILNLADNKLSTVEFNLVSLTVLKTLDLTGNVIHFIEGESLVRLADFVQERTKQENRKKFEILLRNNPLLCECESTEFISWLQVLEKDTQVSQYKCEYMGSSVPIDEKAIDKCKFLCKRTLIIVFSTIASVAVVLLVCVSAYYIWRDKRRRQVQRTVRDFQDAFNAGLLQQKYICFVAYAGKDEEIVRRTLLTPLDNTLKEKLMTNKRTVSTGYDFKPGFPIYDEAFRFVQDSCVFIAVVSDAFCQSEYCKGEIREAYTQQKPIIVVLLGTVTETKMSPYLLEVFRRQARAKITRDENGHIELVPELNTTAESVLALAVDGYEADL